MVVICNTAFPHEPIVYGGVSLSDFQQWAIKAIKDGEHVLVTAHTGSGKTLPAEFAIEYFTAPERKKKVIYASPIKALSNQKLYDMRRKFPHISFGILTGDCKDNPDADVLIMTTEILRNKLLARASSTSAARANSDSTSAAGPSAAGPSAAGPSAAGPSASTSDSTSAAGPSALDFAMNFDTELAAVIFDEVHYINDVERGTVWEQAILLLPPHIQLIMLSATIDKPEEFAGWIEREKKKTVYLASTHTRVVPLSHYMWFSVHEGSLKKSAKSPYESKLEALRRMPLLIANSDGKFREDNFYKVKDVLDYLYKNNMARIKRQYVLAELLGFLKQKEMLPAICFLFSRKHVEQAAEEIKFSLFDDADSAPLRVEQECRHILQAKLPNYAEYMALPEYAALLKMLQKGIAIHHAGIIPVLREMVELLFEKGFIRLLIATETFAVGINMPTKTVIFAGLSKFNGNTMRLLFPHEYTQMAGRAGRRGKDVVGHVFHCVNLFELPTLLEYKHMLTGPPQTLTSKFKISFNTALAMLECNQDMSEFMSQSLLSLDLKRELKYCEQTVVRLTETVESKREQIALCRTPEHILRIYKTIFDKLPHMVNGDRKAARKELAMMEDLYKFILPDLLKIDALKTAQEAVDKAQIKKENTLYYVENTILSLTILLTDCGFMGERLVPTLKGRIAAQLQETHPLAMADLYLKTEKFASFSAARLAGLFSCFYPVHVSDEYKVYDPPLSLREAVKILYGDMTDYLKREQREFLDTGAPYELYYELPAFVIAWCESTDESQCKQVIQDLKEQTGLFLGEFIKALLKVNAIAQEFERVCELTQELELLQKLREIPALTLKYIATSQSLYI